MEIKTVYESPATEVVEVLFEVNILSGEAQITGYDNAFEL